MDGFPKYSHIFHIRHVTGIVTNGYLRKDKHDEFFQSFRKADIGYFNFLNVVYIIV